MSHCLPRWILQSRKHSPALQKRAAGLGDSTLQGPWLEVELEAGRQPCWLDACRVPVWCVSLAGWVPRGCANPATQACCGLAWCVWLVGWVPLGSAKPLAPANRGSMLLCEREPVGAGAAGLQPLGAHYQVTGCAAAIGVLCCDAALPAASVFAAAASASIGCVTTSAASLGCAAASSVPTACAATPFAPIDRTTVAAAPSHTSCSGAAAAAANKDVTG
eukprot:scaffold85185_cov14-Tisochrysis_lutea.AAC.1